jgi:hypothetical protein
MSWLPLFVRQRSKSNTVYRPIELGRAKSDGGVKVSEQVFVQGWPKFPRQLKGISLLYFIGDCFLLLLLIAFIGKCTGLSHM